MRTKHIIGILVLLALALPAPPAHAGGVVSVCDEAHLLAALAGGGTVTFACSGTITLTATLTIAADTTIDGSGQAVIISGNHAVRVFYVNEGVTLNLNRLTIANGSATYGGGIYSDGNVTVRNSVFSGNEAYYIGGGILNSGGSGGSTLTVSNSTFSSNSTISTAGAGAGIFSYDGIATVSNSTFSDNSAAWYGGGISNQDTLIVSNCTFSGNSTSATSSFGGGGIYSHGTATVSNSTFSGNNASEGGGIYSHTGGTVVLENTIVANSPSGSNCSGTITDGSGNLSYSDTTCPGINADPMLGPLQDNGGLTWTMALGPGSAAIDAGNDAICAAAPVNNLDQRGVVRPLGRHCDIGAVEQQPYRTVWFPIACAH